MAKTKVKKSKKEVVDLKPKADQLTQEELEQVQQLTGTFDMYHKEIGNLESRKYQFLLGITSLQQKLAKVQEDLKEKYGDVDIDIRTGAIKPSENGELNKKD